MTERWITALHWRDFEVLVDQRLLASGSSAGSASWDGHRRRSPPWLEQAATGERGFVQVKSRAGTKELGMDDLGRFKREESSRLDVL